MKSTFLTIAMTLTLAACATTAGQGGMLAADAPRALPAEGAISVSWTDPSKFSEITSSGNQHEAAEGDWLTQIAKYTRSETSKYLPAGHTLELTILDIKRAGQFEPWHGPGRHDVRIIRDIYPPRMTVQFRQVDAAGQVVAVGERKLTDMGFLTHTGSMLDNDPLRYEKRMLDTWVRREFRQSPDTP
jgi:hypothetical protein